MRYCRKDSVLLERFVRTVNPPFFTLSVKTSMSLDVDCQSSVSATKNVEKLVGKTTTPFKNS